MPRQIIERLKSLDYLIFTRGTGTPKHLAEKLDISESTLYEYLHILKELGAPIKYDKLRESYFYEKTGSLKIKFE